MGAITIQFKSKISYSSNMGYKYLVRVSIYIVGINVVINNCINVLSKKNNCINVKVTNSTQLN